MRRSRGRAAVVALNRGLRRGGTRFDCWWAYCEQHLYGRWIENGEVVCWRLSEVEPVE